MIAISCHSRWILPTLCSLSIYGIISLQHESWPILHHVNHYNNVRKHLEDRKCTIQAPSGVLNSADSSSMLASIAIMCLDLSRNVSSNGRYARISYSDLTQTKKNLHSTNMRGVVPCTLQTVSVTLHNPDSNLEIEHLLRVWNVYLMLLTIKDGILMPCCPSFVTFKRSMTAWNVLYQIFFGGAHATDRLCSTPDQWTWL